MKDLLSLISQSVAEMKTTEEWRNKVPEIIEKWKQA